MKMTRLLKLIFCTISLVSCKTLKTDIPYENVIVLLVDDLGYYDLADYGNKFHKTPNIDALASVSTKFIEAYAPAPICSPSRASILTGRYTTTIGITDFITGRERTVDKTQDMLPASNKTSLDKNFTTLATVLSERGYKTASIGKWHLGGVGSLPEDHGFQINIGGNHRGMPNTYYHPYNNIGSESIIPHLEIDKREDEYLTDRITREAIKFIKENDNNPFFLYLPYFTVHIPIEGRPDLVNIFEKRADILGLKNANVHYAAMVAALDESVGRIIEVIKTLGLDKNTMIIISSDNGGLHSLEGPRTPATDNGLLRQGKGWLYEGGIKVPLYLHRSQQTTSEVIERPVSLMGIFPTILEGLGIHTKLALDGKSFYSKSIAKDSIEPLFWHYPHYSNQGGTPSSAIRKGNYKLIYFYETNKKELYNLKEDLAESIDISASNPFITENLYHELEQWLKNTGAKYPIKLTK